MLIQIEVIWHSWCITWEILLIDGDWPKQADAEIEVASRCRWRRTSIVVMPPWNPWLLHAQSTTRTRRARSSIFSSVKIASVSIIFPLDLGEMHQTRRWERWSGASGMKRECGRNSRRVEATTRLPWPARAGIGVIQPWWWPWVGPGVTWEEP
jgi:hypothetical protein